MRPGGRGSAPGYVLFGVLVGAVLLSLGMMAAVSLWSRVVQREREAELLFRGEAIVRALDRYQQDRPGTLPETLDELVEGRYLRRAFRDPMTRGPFRLLRAEGAAGETVGGPPPNPREDAPFAASPGETGERSGEGGRGGEDEEGEDDGSGSDSGASRGIVGVVSTSDALSFRTYEGARRYSEWRFEVSAAASAGRRSRER